MLYGARRASPGGADYQFCGGILNAIGRRRTDHADAGRCARRAAPALFAPGRRPFQAQPVAAVPEKPPAVARAVQGQASFEGPDNAVEISLPKRPIAEVPRAERKRQPATAQRKTREVIAQSQRDEEELANPPTYRETRVVRTYEARSRGFGGLFFSDDED